MPRFSFALLLIPVVLVSCSQNNVTVDGSLQKYFDSAGVKGSFGLFDNGQGRFTIYNLPRYRDSVYQPAATFELVQSLIGIQTGVVMDDSTVGFGAMVSHIGRDTVKKWIDSLGYGNKDLGQADSSFWNDNHLKVSSDEQLGFIKKLYFDQLPFFKRTQLLTRRRLSEENNSNYQLWYKTGQGVKEDGHAIGWVVGWVEENKHPYFFVVNLESANAAADLSKAGLAVAHGILSQLGFFQGKR
jgi:beta-lactamase class D